MPYAPGTEYRGDQYVFQGGQHMADAVSGWLENFLNQQKQVTAAGKSADYFVKANPDSLGQMGIHEEEWANLGAREKANAVNGFVQGQASKNAAAELQAKMQLQQAQAAKAQEDADAAQGMPQFAEALNQEMTQAPQSAPPGIDLNSFNPGQQAMNLAGGQPVQTSAPPPTMTGAVMRALARVRAMNPRLAAAVASKVLPNLLQNAGSDGNATPAEKKMTDGSIVFYQPGTKNPLVVSPNSKSEATAAAQQAVLQTKADLHQKLLDAGFAPAKNGKTGEVIPDVYVDAQGKPLDLRPGVTKMTGQAVKPSPAPADITYLKKNPTKRDLFDAQFGDGAAAKVLGK
jgi:hypothetical protein